MIPGGDPRDSGLVEKLAKAYICKDSCIILLTIACESQPVITSTRVNTLPSFIADYENQGAHRLASQYDTNGSRTIGIPILYWVSSVRRLMLVM